jgi:uncharacterized lipoprotein YajG
MKNVFKSRKPLLLAGLVGAGLLIGCAVQTLQLPIPGPYYPKTAAIGQGQTIVVNTNDARSRGVLDQNSYMSDYPIEVSGDMHGRLETAMTAMIKARGFTPSTIAAKDAKTYLTVTVNDVHLWPAPQTLQRQTRAQVVLSIVAHNMGNSYEQTYTGKATHDSIIPASKEMNVSLSQSAFDQALNQVYNDQKLWDFFNKGNKKLWMLS